MAIDNPASDDPAAAGSTPDNLSPTPPASRASLAREAMVQSRELIARLRESGNPDAILCPLPPSERGLFVMNTMGWVIGESQVENAARDGEFRMPFRWIMTCYGRLVTDLENPGFHSITWPKDSDFDFWDGAVRRLRAVADKHGVASA